MDKGEQTNVSESKVSFTLTFKLLSIGIQTTPKEGAGLRKH